MVINNKRKPTQSAFQPWLWPVLGIFVALLLVALLDKWLLGPPIAEIGAMLLKLGLYSGLSILVSFFIFRFGWQHSPSLSYAILLTLSLVGALMLFNGGVAASLMIVDATQLVIVGLLFLFAVIVGIAFGLYGFSQTVQSLRDLAASAHRLSEGDLGVRVEVPGRDEVAQLGEAFNEMAMALQVAEEKRHEVEKMRRDLIAWISHDLRTPLTSIRAMVEALNDGLVVEDGMVKRYYGTISAEVIALNTLIDDLFELAQLDTGGLPLNFAEVAFSDLISDSLEGFTAVVKKGAIALSADICENLDPVVLDPRQISRVISNIISNAIQYTPEGGKIEIVARRLNGEISLAITDSGPGFSENDLDKVFEKFYRGEDARSRAKGKGGGLGLAIARGIIEAHHGRIIASNDIDGGAKVQFFIPAASIEA